MRGLGRNLGQWRKSSYSPTASQCIEAILDATSRVGIRDSMYPQGTEFMLTPLAWVAFIHEVRVSGSRLPPSGETEPRIAHRAPM
ncbi:DUF397 domain-containing protein [Nocardiopsis sp. LOL_012]|uniref:DUF397 domain-containing protein n=1 Tax=Nocardiopsis sp. LOL_012 TaxID=3345409 RepID=UPI003A8485D7